MQSPYTGYGAARLLLTFPSVSPIRPAIVGNGIRESVEAIPEYLHARAGLHFSLGLVEVPMYTSPSPNYAR